MKPAGSKKLVGVFYISTFLHLLPGFTKIHFVLKMMSAYIKMLRIGVARQKVTDSQLDTITEEKLLEALQKIVWQCCSV